MRLKTKKIKNNISLSTSERYLLKMIRKATLFDPDILTNFAVLLLDNHTVEYLKCEFSEIIQKTILSFLLFSKTICRPDLPNAN